MKTYSAKQNGSAESAEIVDGMSTEGGSNVLKRVAMLQPGYLPWLGFFEQMSRCDVFVYFDDAQYTKKDWRNRNRIKTNDGTMWLTVPVSYKTGQRIKDVHISNSIPWGKEHVQKLRTFYQRSRFYRNYREEIEKILSKKWTYLVDLDVELIQWCMEKLNLKKKTILSSEIATDTQDRQLKPIEICKTLGCDYLYEGKSGQNIFDTCLFESHGIAIEFQDYQHPFYNQLWTKEHGFISHLSIIDLLFNCGQHSLDILTGRKIIALPPETPNRHADEFKKS